MGRGGEEDHAPLLVFRKGGEQLIALLTAAVGADTGMSLIDNDEIRAMAGKDVTATFGLDVVETDDSKGMHGEDVAARRQPPLQLERGRGGDGHRLDAEMALQLFRPLFHQVWGAEHGKGIHLAAIHEFAQDEAGLDGLADADIIGDEQAQAGLSQGHEQRYQLVGARLEGDLGGGAEGTSAAAQGETQGIGQQQGAAAGGPPGILRQAEGGRFDGQRFQLGQQVNGIFLAAGERTQFQKLRLIGRQHDPFAVARTYEIPGRE